MGLYSERRARAKGAAPFNTDSACKVCFMPRSSTVPFVIIGVILLLLVGGVVALANRNGEKPLTHVEKVVPLASLQK